MKKVAEPVKPKRKRADARDTVLGAKIRVRRLALGLSQAHLASVIGVSHQQVQKYEAGGDRISALMLLDIAEALRTTPDALLQGLDRRTKLRLGLLRKRAT